MGTRFGVGWLAALEWGLSTLDHVLPTRSPLADANHYYDAAPRFPIWLRIGLEKRARVTPKGSFALVYRSTQVEFYREHTDSAEQDASLALPSGTFIRHCHSGTTRLRVYIQIMWTAQLATKAAPQASTSI